jgi:hypothetical protein
MHWHGERLLTGEHRCFLEDWGGCMRPGEESYHAEQHYRLDPTWFKTSQVIC